MRASAGKAGYVSRLIKSVAIGCAIAATPLLSGSLDRGAAYAQVSTSYSRIDVSGNLRIEADTVRVIAGIPTNQRVSPSDLNQALQNLFDSGLFETVELLPQAGRLTIKVVENPTINQIAFEGNDELVDEALASVVRLQPRQAYNAASAEADALRIVEAYRAAGRFAAEVQPVVIRRTENRVDLVFEITEGRVTEVQRISFVGNEHFSDRRLRRVISSGQAGFLSGFFDSGTFDRDRVQLDQQLLRQFYLDRGYVDFEVRSVVSELARDRAGFFVSFNISEGQQYRFGDLGVSSSVGNIDASQYERMIDVRSGGVYSASDVEDVIERIALAVDADGFPFTDVQPRVTRNDASRTIDLDFEIVRGPRVFVERIDIEGNTETLDRVIRRQFQIAEGDPLSRRDIRRAENRIRALRIFEDVRVNLRQGSSPERAIIDVDVVERPTGALSFGLGFSSDGGLYGSLSLTESNFLGRGQAFSTEINVSQDRRILAFSFTEPSLLDRDLLGGVDLFYRQFDRDESSFQETNIGFSPRIGFPVSEDGRMEISYSISNDEIRDVEDDASILITEGDALTSAISFAYTLDKRDSVVDPRSGFRLRLEQEFAGLGGDTNYSKTSGSIKGFSTLLSEDIILSAELEGGVLAYRDGDSRITDRFFLGGNSLRGFATGGIGPRDVCTSCVGAGGAGQNVNDALGGNSFVVGRLEASFPLGLPEEYGIFGGVFYDVGSVWGLDNTAGSSGTIDDSQILRSAAGLSLFWSTPIGPLRFNWAWPIQKESFDETEDFRITIDTRF